ncbi:SDR family oxidoreductase [Pelagibius sp. 7325]|uniref:SDR family oxidoreductase n=1 Tax=Pelagibius sp. 7325 TaxID=3131994 RepID=UPI0030EC27F1
MNFIDRMRPAAGLRVLITAGASGIGAVIAKAFLEVDAKVMICDIDTPALTAFTAAHPGLLSETTDVSDAGAVETLIDSVRTQLGGLDVLVNNAGIAGPTGRIDTLEVDDIRRTIEIDLMSQFLVTRRSAGMLRESRGVILNMSSVAGRLGISLRTPYAAAKWGIVGLTESLARELGPDGVRVNAILPGIVRGDRIEKVLTARAKAEGVTYDEMEKLYLQNTSLRRMVEPEDIASMALFLCSPAGANLSGQAISVCANVETL